MLEKFFDETFRIHRTTFLLLIIVNLFILNFLSAIQKTRYEYSHLQTLSESMDSLLREYIGYHCLLDEASRSVYRGYRSTSFKCISEDNTCSFYIYRSFQYDNAYNDTTKPYVVFHFSPLFRLSLANISYTEYRSHIYSIAINRSSEAQNATPNTMDTQLDTQYVDKINMYFNTLYNEEMRFGKYVNPTSLLLYFAKFSEYYNTSAIYKETREREGEMHKRDYWNTFYSVILPTPMRVIENMSLRQLELFSEYIHYELKDMHSRDSTYRLPIVNFDINHSFIRIINPYFILILLLMLCLYHEQMHILITKNTDVSLNELLSILNSSPWICGNMYVCQGLVFVLSAAIYFLAIGMSVFAVSFNLYHEVFYGDWKTLSFGLTAILPLALTVIISLRLMYGIYIHRVRIQALIPPNQQNAADPPVRGASEGTGESSESVPVRAGR